MHNLPNRLQEMLDEREMSKTDLWKACNLSSGAVSHWFNGGRLKGENLIKAAQVLGVTPSWLETGKGPKYPTSGQDVLQLHNENVINVLMFDSEPSMGRGAPMLEHDTVIGGMRLNENWVRRNVTITSPTNLAILSAYGDSMSPSFNDGDLLLVDRGIQEIKLDAVYVIALNDELFVKRVQRMMDGAVIIKSDNPLYDPHVINNGDKSKLMVLGRVLWSWNGKKL